MSAYCEGCGKEGSTMRCPTCNKLKLPPSLFCGQECFKANWSTHKEKHLQTPTSLFVNDVTAAAYDFLGGDKCDWTNMCWTSIVIHNFLMLAVEKKRTLLLRNAAEPAGEMVETLAVHDREPKDGVHSWNVFTAASGTYAADIAVSQYTKLHDGYQIDGLPSPPSAVVKGPSRLIKKGKKELHVGTLSYDEGLLPPKTTEVQNEIPDGATQTYLNFLVAAEAGSFGGMTKGAKNTAKQLQLSNLVPLMLRLHSGLAKKFGFEVGTIDTTADESSEDDDDGNDESA